MKRLSFILFTMFLVIGAVSGSAQTFTTTMSGSRETGGGDPAGRGLAVITINGTNVYYFLWVQNIASPVAAHIHTGNQGVSGGVLIGLDPVWSSVGTNTYMAAGSVPVDTATTQPILDNPVGYYVNVHNGPYPNGAMRGQLLGDGPSGFALATTLLGFRESGGGSPSGQGFAAVIFDSGASKLYYYLWETGIGAPTAAHIHTGGAGTSGPVLVGLSPSFTNGQAFGNVAVDPATLAAIQAAPDVHYVNIHNADFPNGALRGQLAATEFEAMLTVAAHNAGLGTSFFRTDMRAMSLTDEPATVYGEWYPHGVTNATGPATRAQFVIPAGGEAVYDDVVSVLFGAGTRGAIRLLSAVPFAETARNYNDQRPVGGGTFGEDNPGLGLNGALTSGALLLNSNRPKADGLGSRTNVGYFNPSPYSIDVTFNVRTPDGVLVAPPSKTTLPPWADDQAAFYQFIPGIPSSQDTLANFSITFTATKPVFLFSSLADNKTDDGVHQNATPVPATLTVEALSAPTATITTPAGNVSATVGHPVDFVGSGSDPNGLPFTGHWDFGDGASADGLAVSHTYSAAGTFTASFTVTDSLNLVSAPDQITVTVTALQLPTATITTPTGNVSITTGQSVSFVGTGSDPNGLSFTGHWNFGDGGSADGLSVTHMFASPGTFTVSFTVTDTQSLTSAPATRIVTTLQHPTATITTPTGNVSITAGQSVSFVGTGSDPNGLSFTGHWDFGDSVSADGLSVTHTFASPGTFTVSFTVTDTQNLTSAPAHRTVTAAAALTATLSSIQSNIFTPRCSGCHPPNQGQDLRAGKSFASIVNVASMEQPSLLRVKPGDPTNSYLYRKITGAAGITGSKMPLGGSLTAAEIQAIHDWIAAGALNN